MAMTAVDLMQHPETVQAAQREYAGRIGPDFEYASLVGDRAPPLDYRNPAQR
jgi:aminobenzoyl-glutamate utilization protein B